MRRCFSIALALACLAAAPEAPRSALPYPIVGTGQEPGPRPPSYRDNGDGTVTDLVTGLVWVRARGAKATWREAMDGAAKCRVGGHSDWRMPTIKELYSLIDFRGRSAMTADASKPYINTSVFEFKYGDDSRGERVIDCQDWSATSYAATTMNGDPTAFGVNFADGRIKGYPKSLPGQGETRLYARYVRGNPSYGKNDFTDQGNGVILDRATGLAWTKLDSGRAMNWWQAREWVAALNRQRHLGHSDWRLPDAKELQSIVDYTRAPRATDASRRGPAIDPVFSTTRLASGEYPHMWASTTHNDNAGGVYVAFGRALGFMNGAWLDVHGAGAQRSDPKTGDPAKYPFGFGPQGDEVRIYNYVRAVRGGR